MRPDASCISPEFVLHDSAVQYTINQTYRHIKLPNLHFCGLLLSVIAIVHMCSTDFADRENLQTHIIDPSPCQSIPHMPTLPDLAQNTAAHQTRVVPNATCLAWPHRGHVDTSGPHALSRTCRIFFCIGTRGSLYGQCFCRGLRRVEIHLRCWDAWRIVRYGGLEPRVIRDCERSR